MKRNRELTITAYFQVSKGRELTITAYFQVFEGKLHILASHPTLI